MKPFAFCLTLSLASIVHAVTQQAPFRDYRSIFAYIASHEDLVEDHPDLFKLAAESAVEYVEGDKAGEWILVVTPDYRDRRDHRLSAIRGAQGNGPYYVFRQTPAGFKFLGTMSGNRYEVIGQYSGRLRFRTLTHMSAAESEEALYEVDSNGLVKK